MPDSSPLEERDYFTDHSILRDPYAWFEAIRAKGPVHRLDDGLIVVTGFDEMVAVLRNVEDFSSAIAVQGPAVPLPFDPQPHDITGQIAEHRAGFTGGDLVVTYDDMQHARSRALLNRLFVPSRLKANEEYIARISKQMIGEVVARGDVEIIKTIATPFVTLVIADLLGVPDDDRQRFMDMIEAGPPPGSLDDNATGQEQSILIQMGMYFVGYVTDRRANPREDILTELSLATFADGSLPDAMEIVRIATFLFGAGQDTSAKLLGNAIRFLVEDQDLQDRVRADPSLVPALLEEVLRLEGSTKMTARVARRDTHVGDLEAAAGTRVLLALSAANRDPRRWTDPTALILDRPKIREHLGFGRGAHVCIGAPLARVEVRLILEELLRQTSRIELDEGKHGPAGDRTLEYEASFIIRGLAEMHLKLTPAADFVAPEKVETTAATPAVAETPGGPRFSTAGSKIGELLGDPAARAVIDRHFPGVSGDARIGMASGMTLRMVQSFAPDMFDGEALDAADADLAGLS